MSRCVRSLVVLVCAMAGGVASHSFAQSDAVPGYPARPIRMIVPFPPGGSNDIMGRYVAHYLTERLGRQVVLDNRPGADGIIGTEIVARAQPDGYTLLVASAAHAVNGGTRKLTFDPVNSFAWAGTLGLGPSVVSVHTALPVTTLKELLAHGKAHPGKLVLSTSGGFAQFGAELFHHMSGMKLIVVVYKGGFPALMDAMAGQAQINMGALIQTLPHLKSGKIRALATTGVKRAAPTPEIPTVAEAGVPGFEANNWWAVAAPAGTPAGIVTRLNTELRKIIYSHVPEEERLGQASMDDLLNFKVATKVTHKATIDTADVTASSRSGEYGSSNLPAMPEVSAKPAIIISHTVVAAAARRGAATRLASSTSSEVPLALTPTPIIRKAGTASPRPAARLLPIQTVASAAATPPSASVAMPPTIHGVRRRPVSDPWPMRGRTTCTR